MATTIATVKSFIKKNRKNLFVRIKSRFNGMSDSVESVKDDFTPALPESRNEDHNLGVSGLWFVNGGRDGHKSFENDRFVGFEVYNSCGSFIVAIQK